MKRGGEEGEVKNLLFSPCKKGSFAVASEGLGGKRVVAFSSLSDGSPSEGSA